MAATVSRTSISSLDDLTSVSARLLQHEGTAKTIKTMNGRLKDNTTIYRQSPSPEVDQAWGDLGINCELYTLSTVPGTRADETYIVRTALVPEARGKEAGIDHSAVKVEAAQGGGYLTNVQALHHVHCLNMLRQVLPWNVDYYRSNGTGVFENTEPIVRLHVGKTKIVC